MSEGGFPTIPKRRSDKTAKSGEDMMAVLVDDIIKYESLAEKEELLLLSSLVSVGVNDGFEVELEELNLPTDRPPTHTNELCEQNSEIKRYKEVTVEETKQFIMDNRNKNTSYKTKSDVKMFVDWCKLNGELRLLENIPTEEFDNLLARFYLEEFWRRKEKSGERKQKKKRAESIEADEIKLMYTKQLLRAANPASLLNTVWPKNLLFFGFRGRQEHATLVFGDLELKKNASGLEYVEFNERSTKTRNGSKNGDYSAVPPKMFAQPDNDCCPVKMFICQNAR